MYLNFRNMFQKLLIENLSKHFSLKSCEDGAARISDVAKLSEGKMISVKCWVKHIRVMKNDYFVDVNDGSSCRDLQLIISKQINLKLAVGDSIEARGFVGLSPRNIPEVIAEEVKILGRGNISDGYPFTPKQEHPPEYAREYLHLRPRLRNISSMLRVRHKAFSAIHDFLDNRGFVHIHTPILTSNDCEGAGEIFTVKPDIQKENHTEGSSGINQVDNYFDKAYLSVSGQFHLEAMSHSLGHTYTLNPAFRAENSKSPLHLSEFYMLEAEMAFCTDILQLTDFIELLIKTVTEKMIMVCEEDIKNCVYRKNQKTAPDFAWINHKWPVITYDDAYKILSNNKQHLKTHLEKREGFSKEQELFLVNKFQSPVFIINWRKSSKPFYMKEIPQDPDKVYALDLLAPNVGELVGGSLREDDYSKLKAKTPKELEWYLDLRKFGGVPTGGFGLGFERYLQLITGITNIKDVIPFPRWAHNCNM